MLRSSIHLFIHLTVLSSFGNGPIAVFSAIAVFTPAQKIRTKGVNELEFDSIKPIKIGVDTPLVSMSCQINTFILFKYLKTSKSVHEFIKASFWMTVLYKHLLVTLDNSVSWALMRFGCIFAPLEHKVSTYSCLGTC